MAKIKGICRNVDGCDLAADKVVQEVEKTEFVCSECGKPLYPLEDKRKAKSGSKKPLIIGIIAAAVLAVLGGIFALIGGGSDPVENVPVATPDTTVVTKHDTVTLTNTETRVDTVKIEKTVEKETTPIAKKTTTTTTTTTKSSGTSSGTIRLSYGTYSGATKGGYPHGQGRLTYSTTRQINRNDAKGRTANPGDYVIGEFFNGFVVYGKHYSSSGELLGSLNFGVGSESSYESK